MNIHLIAVGRLRKGPFYELFCDYEKRLNWSLSVTEIESKHTAQDKMSADECTQIMQALNPQAFIIGMDERGKTLSSRDFSTKIQELQNQSQNHLQFVIGGADGLNDDIRKKCNLLLSFGKQTWPHMLARVMLLEQIYRCQQILKGHPYHRD